MQASPRVLGGPALAAQVAQTMRQYPDFPSAGVLFRDLCPVFASPSLLRAVATAITDRYAGGFDRVVAIEARGFVVGTMVADVSGRPLTLARKRGKLPGRVRAVDYSLEYGLAVLEVQHDALVARERVLVVDDVLATGGTLAAAGALVIAAGALVAGYAVVLSLADLGGAARLDPAPVFAVLTV